MAARIRETTTGTVRASIIICHAASTAAAVWVVVVVVEEDRFGGGGSFEGCRCEFFVEFAGAPTPDAVSDEGNDEGKPEQSDDAENASYSSGVGKESKMKFWLDNISNKNEFERKTKYSSWKNSTFARPE